MAHKNLTKSKKQAVKTSGFRARQATKSGRNILQRRRLKGRKVLAISFFPHNQNLTGNQNRNRTVN